MGSAAATGATVARVGRTRERATGGAGGGGGAGGAATGTGNGGNGGAGGAGGDCTIIVNNVTQVNQTAPVSWTLPTPIFASVPVYRDIPLVSVQVVEAPPIVTCAMPLGILYGRPVEPKLQPVIVDGFTVDFLPLCQTFGYEPFLDCGTAYYYYAEQNIFYCVVPA